jgi:hypothetical protein
MLFNSPAMITLKFGISSIISTVPIIFDVPHIRLEISDNFFEKISTKCNQRPLCSEIDCQGIANILTSLAKMIDSWPELSKTQKFNATMVALLFHVERRARKFKFQEVSLQVWQHGSYHFRRAPHQVGDFFGFGLFSTFCCIRVGFYVGNQRDCGLF